MGGCELFPFVQHGVKLIEQVCVTLYDWRTFPEQFAKSRNPDEKNLYTFLTQAVGPAVITALLVRP